MSRVLRAPGGVTAVIVRYADGRYDYLVDMGEATGQPGDNGRATQCKIHYSMIVDESGRSTPRRT